MAYKWLLDMPLFWSTAGREIGSDFTMYRFLLEMYSFGCSIMIGLVWIKCNDARGLSLTSQSLRAAQHDDIR